MANEEEIQSMKDFDEASAKPLEPGSESIVEERAMPEDQMFYGGRPPLRGARRPKGMTKVDEFGNEIDNPFEEKKSKKDITQMPEFIEAFGGSTAAAIKRSASKEKNDNNAVTIIHGKGKPMEITGNSDPRSLNK